MTMDSFTDKHDLHIVSQLSCFLEHRLNCLYRDLKKSGGFIKIQFSHCRNFLEFSMNDFQICETIENYALGLKNL